MRTGVLIVIVLFNVGACAPSHPSKAEPPACVKIAEIRSLPMKEPRTDPVYRALVAQPRARAISCLINDVTSTEKIADPRESFSRPDGIAKGDLAVFLLLDLTEQDWLDIVPRELHEGFRANGMFAYFEFVEQPGNREVVQEWWNAWFGAHYG